MLAASGLGLLAFLDSDVVSTFAFQSPGKFGLLLSMGVFIVRACITTSLFRSKVNELDIIADEQVDHRSERNFDCGGNSVCPAHNDFQSSNPVDAIKGESGTGENCQSSGDQTE